jgi:hypothetical protein
MAARRKSHHADYVALQMPLRSVIPRETHGGFRILQGNVNLICVDTG